MKKRVLALMMLFLLIGLFGCAKTQVTDVFRFEVRELEMTLYADETKNLEKELGLIKGDIDKDRLSIEHPEIDIESYRKPSTTYSTIRVTPIRK